MQPQSKATRSVRAAASRLPRRDRAAMGIDEVGVPDQDVLEQELEEYNMKRQAYVERRNTAWKEKHLAE